MRRRFLPAIVTAADIGSGSSQAETACEYVCCQVIHYLPEASTIEIVVNAPCLTLTALPSPLGGKATWACTRKDDQVSRRGNPSDLRPQHHGSRLPTVRTPDDAKGLDACCEARGARRGGRSAAEVATEQTHDVDRVARLTPTSHVLMVGMVLGTSTLISSGDASRAAHMTHHTHPLVCTRMPASDRRQVLYTPREIIVLMLPRLASAVSLRDTGQRVQLRRPPASLDRATEIESVSDREEGEEDAQRENRRQPFHVPDARHAPVLARQVPGQAARDPPKRSRRISLVESPSAPPPPRVFLALPESGRIAGFPLSKD
ncbi:unnamed protein product [Diplocarpon coronariae]